MEKCTVHLRSSCHASLLTLGNVDDGALLKHIDFHKRIFGKLFGDRGYISKDLFEQLFIDGVHLIMRLKKSMKNALMLQHDKIMLRKRSLIEIVNDQLKNVCQIELGPPSMLPKLHHQSVIGFGRFLLLRQKTFHQYRRGDSTHLFPPAGETHNHAPEKVRDMALQMLDTVEKLHDVLQGETLGDTVSALSRSRATMQTRSNKIVVFNLIYSTTFQEVK